MRRGCPQGSIIGSAAWNWAMDDLLNNIEIDLDENKVEAFAYADDLAILIKANSRRGIEDLGNKIIQKIDSWCALYKLKVSAAKTVAMIVKNLTGKDPQHLKLQVSKLNMALKLDI